MTTANLKLLYGGSGNLLRVAANQTYTDKFGIGGIFVPLTTVTTATNMLVLNGLFSLRQLYIDYIAGDASNLTVVLTIDGRTVLNTIIPLGTSSGTANIFGNSQLGMLGGEIEVISNLTLSVQRSVAAQVSVTANAIKLV